MLSMGIRNNRAILLIFYVELSENMLGIILYTEFTMGPPWLGPEKIVLTKRSQNAQMHNFRFICVKTES